MGNGIRYECYVRYSGKDGWNRPFLSVHDISKSPLEYFPTTTLEFKRFKPSRLKAALLQQGKINPRDSSFFDQNNITRPLEKIDRIDAFLDIEGIDLGGWRVFQSLIIPDLPRKNNNDIWIAYAGRDNVEIFNPIGPKKINDVELGKVIPIGDVVTIKMTHSTGIRQKLIDEMPNLMHRIKNYKPSDNINAVLHVRLDIGENYANLIVGNYS